MAPPARWVPAAERPARTATGAILRATPPQAGQPKAASSPPDGATPSEGLKVTVSAPHPQSAPAVSPWLQMAHVDAADWFRRHPGAPLTDYAAWCEGYEYGQVLAAGYGWQPGDVVTRQMQDALDAAVVGLDAARGVEEARRAGRRAAGGVAGRVGRLEWDWARDGAA